MIADASTTKRSIGRSLCLVILALLGSCSGATVQVDYDKQTNFALLRSFAFKPVENPSNPERLVKEAIQRELLAKGFREISRGTEDYRVEYHAALKDKTIWQSEYSPSGVPMGRTPITFEEGTIAIQMIDPKSGKTIWTGTAEKAVDDQSQALQDIQPEVQKILARFPPR